jgi:glyoxylase-like metal-dependent hydrolase (beta-lactamase superfamily II)
VVIDQIGEVTEQVYLLGHPRYPLYLIDCDRPVIIDAGFSFTADDYAEQIRSILKNRHPSLCLLTHVHYDHCGGTAGLKRHFPDMQVAASGHAASLIEMPGVIERIGRLSRSAMDETRDFNMRITNSPSFEPFRVDMALSEGQVLELQEGLSIVVIEAPGHTRDMICYYVPESQVFFSSEATGVPDTTGYIMTECLLDYDLYAASMEKIAQLDIAAVCLGHRFAYTSGDAARYLADARNQTKGFLKSTIAIFQEEGGDMERTMNRVRAIEYDPKPKPKQPEAAYLLNLQARVTAISRKISNIKSRSS